MLRNFHRFLARAEVVQALDTQIAAGKQDRTFVVILAPVVQIPVELEKQFVVVEHDLPGRDQLEAIARGVATEPGELPEGDGLDAVLDAAAGLTRVEAENAFSLSLVRHGRLAPDVLWEMKMQALKKSGLLEMHRGGETFADLGGLEALKAFCLAGPAEPASRAAPSPRACSCSASPGTGKSRLRQGAGQRDGPARRSSSTWARSRARLVGQTEERTPAGAAACRRRRPSVAFVDEIEKGLAGVQPAAARPTAASPPASSARCCRTGRPRRRRRSSSARPTTSPGCRRSPRRGGLCAVLRLISIESQTPGVWTNPPEGTGLGDPRKG